MKRSKLLLLFFTVFSFVILNAAFIEGYVRDMQDGSALSGTSIYFRQGGQGCISDKNGYFRLNRAKTGKDTLVAKRIGYKLLTYPTDSLTTKALVLQMETEVLQYDHNIIVTATRRPISKYNTSASLSIIAKEEIERSGAQNIAEILNNTTSLQIRDYGGTGNMKTLSLRGTSAGHVLVMVDGQQINNPQNGEVDLALISLDHVERIEVLRGGASAIYGSDAIGGVIQIINKKRG
ncbi:MAG: TonB-dependent receptor plug domain-containing protein [Candidatus Marinimicrobia bacterium]|nr:TonB-dependent receptor plug domain-containing protein [Candidatus Neomarinimicrobiota bacterium]